jgi:hypothetical protein
MGDYGIGEKMTKEEGIAEKKNEGIIVQSLSQKKKSFFVKFREIIINFQPGLISLK